MTPSSAAVAISVIMLAWGDEPYLAECVSSVLADPRPDVEVIVLDNGARPAVEALPAHPRMRTVVAARNLGFSGGCNEAARHAAGDNLVFLNSDAAVLPGAVAVLATAVEDLSVGLASGSIRLADEPDLVNSAGNPVNFLGVAWAGGFGEPASAHGSRSEITSASGAFLAVRREASWPITITRSRETPPEQYQLQRNRWLTVPSPSTIPWHLIMPGQGRSSRCWWPMWSSI